MKRTDNPNLISRARQAAGITQAELAERIGVSTSQLQNWECGLRKPKLAALVKIARALQCDINSLIDPNDL